MHTKAEIDQLEELLNDAEMMPDIMSVGELDGYVAGLLLCPDMILPSEWLAEVWGLDGTPAFESVEQAEATIGAVMAHYNRVAETLASSTEPYEIHVEYVDGQDAPFWEGWIAGFYQAMRLRPRAWDAYRKADDETVVSAMSVLDALLDLYAGDSPLSKADQDALAGEAASLIPGLVMMINRWLKAQSHAAGEGVQDWLSATLTTSGPAQSTKAGRNAPCPCGSGRTYKLCCGAH